MNLWCKIFGWDEDDWDYIIWTYGIRFRYKGHRYIIIPGGLLWILLYAVYAISAIGGFWAFCVLMVMLFS